MKRQEVTKLLHLKREKRTDEFIWITDGQGWKSAKFNLQETFDVMEHIYNLNDLENGVLKKVLK